MDRSKYHRLMFLIAAIWNWALAATFLILPRIDINYFLLGGYTIPPTLLWFDCFMGEILAFGFGFYIVSLNVKANHGIIVIGAFEKLWVFALSLYYFLIHEATPLLLLVVVGDLLFALLFIEDLRAIRRMT